VALEDEIAQIVESYGVTFYDSEIVNENGRDIYRVYITKEGGVDLDTCAKISNDISPLLDINSPIDGTYYLEVSSPGIERKLKKPSHFQNSIGELVKFKTVDGDKLKGVIDSADSSSVTIKVEDDKRVYKYSDISKAKTYFDWTKQKSK